ncbi:MAG TPA: hypothetical protein VGL45_19575 [Bradyrhizobium sp.]|jgi:hypothetical protein
MKRATPRATSRWPVWLNATALLLTSAIAVAALSLQVRPGSEIVAVAFPPWWSTQHVFEAAASANAAIVRMTAIPAVLVVRPDNHEGMTRLREAGAWLTIDPQAIAACFNPPDKGI